MLRWTARLLGTFLAGLAALLMVGERLNPIRMAGFELAMSVAFLTALVGLVVLWKWEGIGGVLVVAGMLAFYGLNLAASGRLPGGWVFPLCFVPGVLSLACWWQDRQKDSGSPRAGE